MLMAYTRDPSTACTHQQRDALLWSPTRDDEQSGRDCFVCHVGQTGTLASEAGPGVLPGFNRSEGIAQSVCWRHPAHSGKSCLLYTSPSPRDLSTSRMPSSA